MKRLALSVSLLLLGSVLMAPAAIANSQVSTPQELGEGATIHDVVTYNRGVRDK